MRVTPRVFATAFAVAGALIAAPAALAAAGPPPPPQAAGGQTVTTVASGLQTPTAIAVGKGQVFEADGGSESSKIPNGGVYALSNGAGTKLAGSPQFVSGLTWHSGSLYVAGGVLQGKGASWQIQRWSGWNGKAFSSRKVIWTAPPGFAGTNGIAFGPDGRIYLGVDVGLLPQGDHGLAKTPYVYDLLSFKADGSDMRVFATGIRQPWQIAFAKGDPDPYVSDLNQDGGPKAARNGPDYVLHVHPGDNYGFPQCNGTQGAGLCGGFTSPFATFTPHTDIMGMAIIGQTLYMTSFLGVGSKGPGGEVLKMPLSGGKATPVLTGFVAPTVGLGVNAGKLYVGELTGQVFSVTP
jgi:glucose/arabinose dehydrogenase